MCTKNLYFRLIAACAGLIFYAALIPATIFAQSAWKAHDLDRPLPPVVTPSDQQLPVPAPADALVLFDGTNLSNWEATDGSPTGWIIEDGAMISVAGAGYVQTKQAFGDVQLHVEWAAPVPASGTSQGRGNSGVFLMGLYEVQVLDSYENETYADGQAAAVYGQYPPLFNAARPPGEWQTYDIFFRRPRFSQAGAVLQKARITVIHNCILVQNNVELWGPTNWLQSLPYQTHPDKLPLAFQDHGNPVRYRNIWLRDLPEYEAAPPVDYLEEEETLSPDVLDRYVGQYQLFPGNNYTITREGDYLSIQISGPNPLEMVAHSMQKFSLKRTAGILEFTLDTDGVPRSVTFYLGGSTFRANKVIQ